MKIGVKSLTGEKLQDVLLRMTDHPVKGILVGFFATGLLQSSSAVMVIAVGLAAGGLIHFRQTLGVMIGANIGTTLTGEIASINFGDYFLIFLVVGVVMLTIPKQKVFCVGAILFGLGCLFTAMNGFTSLSEPLQELTAIEKVIKASNEHWTVASLIGILFTAIIQSSSAATLVAMGFVQNNGISLEAGMAFIIGANIGTCVTALLASIGSNWQARWTAYAHVLYNILGSIILFPFIPGMIYLSSTLSSVPAVQLAHASVIFNLLSGMLALPFLNRFGSYVHTRNIKV